MPTPSFWLGLGLFLGVSATAFETMAVSTVLPTIAEDFNGFRLFGATFAVYMLANMLSLVIAGERADRTGLTRPYVIGAGLFVAGSAVAGLANSMAVVIVGRALQGAGTGIFATLSLVAVRRAYPEERQRRMYAVLSSAWILPSLIAPFAAGWLTDSVSWRWAFAGLIPIPIAVVALTGRRLALIDAHHRLPVPSIRSRVPQAVVVAAGVAALTGASYSADWRVVAPLGVAGSTVTVIGLRRLMPAGMLRARRGRPAAIAARLCAMLAFSAVDLFVPLAAKSFHGASATKQGATILGAAVTWSLAQWYAANRGQQLGSHRLVPTGFALLGLGALGSLTVLVGDLPLWVPFLTWSLGGFGMGLLFNPTSHVAMGSADVETAGLVSTQLTIVDAFGFAVMSAVGGSLVTIAEETSLRLAPALAALFVTAVVITIFGALAGRHVVDVGAAH